MLKIKTEKIHDTAVTVPGSKSYTHRIFIAAALSNGPCCIENWLDSDDTNYTLSALNQFGASIEKNPAGDKKPEGVILTGRNGDMDSNEKPIFLGNSGTSMRLLTAYAAIGNGRYILTGSDRMHERPIHYLLDGLNQLDVQAVSLNNNGCPPVEVIGTKVAGGTVNLNCSISSQFLSGLLLIAPYTRNGMEIHVTHGPVSKPYIDMTLDIMSQFGVDVFRNGYDYFKIPGGLTYQCGRYVVEPDCSQASYFWAAAAITGHAIKVNGISKQSSQGDVRFVDVLSAMGCRVIHESDGITVSGGKLSGIEVDMADMPDMVPTLAVIAAFAKGIMVIKNVSHLKVKESDRLNAVINELTKMGISAKSESDNLIITGGKPHGAVIETYDDHRIAMCFSVAGLRVPGIEIKNEHCVEKSFPTYWKVFDGLYER
ncbi:MAG: 3-phosphoshikimate 1-carboxyvinyltransferase [Desulfobacteraceae bacterium]|nr:3-phosphoshikimate 1-carboxyvinyltransferase [Desulfobacteraceae bacterium]MBC2756912.1 3-phosphoshikimate 1-carboxyvinyltransferase [Desulfobacteraceae bacterium]